MAFNFWDKLLKLSKNKRVLHLGVLGDFNDYLKIGFDDWLFRELIDISSIAVGIDFNKKLVKKAHAAGFKSIIYGNVEKLSLGKKFDVIFAGDIIEHLVNFEGFFLSCKKHMNKDSILVITTPNPFAINNFLKIAISGNPSVYEEHTNYVVEKNFEGLAQIFGFKIIESGYYTQSDRRNLWYSVFSGFINLVGSLRKRFHGSHYVILKLA